MIEGNVEELHKRLRLARSLMDKVTNREDKMALANYIGNLYTAIGNVLDVKVKPKKKQIFGDKKGYHRFYRLYDSKEDEMLENLIQYKEFHSDLLGDIIPEIEEIMTVICDEEMIEDQIISKEEFYTIFMEFMKSINLDGLFEKYLKEKRIHATSLKEGDTCLGATIYNPITKDLDVMVSNFQTTILSMFTLAHEFGHAYDLTNLNADSKTHNRYFYQSYFGEVFSKLFERLFITYLIENDIYKDQAKDKIFQMELINHDYLLASYILSLLDDGYLEEGLYMSMSKEELIYEVQDHFYHEDGIMDYILGVRNLDARDDYTYAYGDIVSMFLKKSVDDCGFSNELVDEFKKIRTELFNPDFLVKHDINADNYVKLYKKEIELLKK